MLEFPNVELDLYPQFVALFLHLRRVSPVVAVADQVAVYQLMKMKKKRTMMMKTMKEGIIDHGQGLEVDGKQLKENAILDLVQGLILIQDHHHLLLVMLQHQQS